MDLDIVQGRSASNISSRKAVLTVSWKGEAILVAMERMIDSGEGLIKLKGDEMWTGEKNRVEVC